MPTALISSSETLLAAARRFTRASYSSNKAIANVELSQSEWHLLLVLKHWPGTRGARPSELAQKLRVTAGNVAQLLLHLENQALIARTPDQKDRRVVLVKLTPTGVDSLEQVRSEFLAQFDQLIRHLGSKESKHFTSLLLSAADFLEQTESSA